MLLLLELGKPLPHSNTSKHWTAQIFSLFLHRAGIFLNFYHLNFLLPVPRCLCCTFWAAFPRVRQKLCEDETSRMRLLLCMSSVVPICIFWYLNFTNHSLWSTNKVSFTCLCSGNELHLSCLCSQGEFRCFGTEHSPCLPRAVHLSKAVPPSL